MIGAAPKLAPDAARVGLRVRAEFRPANDETAYVDFAPAD
jgi:hypothetical protein